MSNINDENKQVDTTPITDTSVTGIQKKGTSGLAIASLVVGILALIGCWIPLFNFVSVWFAFVAIGLGIPGFIITRKGTKSGKNIAISGLVLSILTIIIVVVMYATAGAATDEAADAIDNATKTETSTEASDDAAEPADDKAAVGEGDLGDYHVKIAKSKLSSDWDGKAAIIVTYKFTNNSDKATSFDVALHAQAFQDGLELETSFLSDDSDSYLKDVKPGKTFTVKRVYVLDDKKTPVEVDVSELISFDDQVVTKTFDIK